MHKIACVVLTFLLLLSAGITQAEPDSDSALKDLSIESARIFFPDAQQLAPVLDDIPARPVFDSGDVIGYLFITDEIKPIPAYSGKPISLLVGMAADGEIRGVKILHHEEPVLVIGVEDQHLQKFIDQYTGINADQRVRIGAHDRPGYLGVDGITGATITSMVINHSVIRSAKEVLDAVRSRPKVAPADEQARQQTEAAGVSTEKLDDIDFLRENYATVTLLGAALLFLLGILFFQDWLAKRKRLYEYVRTGYLILTVLYIGIYLRAQLSAVNLFAFAQRLGQQLFWESLLYDVAIFMLWAFVACTILLWGRGVYCGWLCPFGALQELIYNAARKLKVPQFTFPSVVHERLWAIKYFLLIILVGVSLGSMARVAPLLEVEPFKTTFGLLFQREFVYVAYALGLLVAAAFNSRFYCKYLCVLGAALSIFSRFHVFEWLRRRKECGHPCQACAKACPLDAIKPTGEIIDSECHYCLRCQVLYWDEYTCPPLVEKRKRREARERKQQSGNIIASRELR
ncbi:4Fe-4S binding domain-containing protein [Microbulbifer donghaiensis]|uniref:4Fe-4S binding domain-containing protein n=1 Tax=Microbulbifer donghaiensis TaxID=494016 RepID=A0A1M5DZS0_9GAMM|nr:NosR/NirI family protein [Microbulbifer donghaiensis]SHF72322.1 4Fe-4S binding domain-containing protein [Microbulbifer donghaiensis]